MPLDQAVSTRSGSDQAAAPKGDIDQVAINTIRTLAIDAVQKANSGHAGAPMGFAPVAYTLWTRFLRYDPAEPLWPNRDRFVLSNGHASMLLYSLLHLGGVEASTGAAKPTGAPAVSLDDIKQFRQLDSDARPSGVRPTRPASKPPPARSARASATSVGMAMAERWLAAHFNRPGHDAVRLQRLCHLQRRRPDGGRLRRGRLARRPPEALQPVLDLRRQPHHHRRLAPSWPSPRTSSKRFEGYGWATHACRRRQRLRGARRRRSSASRPPTTGRR